jgi:hypothetical protein
MNEISGHRNLTAQEAALVRWLLQHGSGDEKTFLAQLSTIRVVSRCRCGCASIDFVQDRGAGLRTLSDFQWSDAKGRLFGVFAFAIGERLAGLEVWSIDGQATPYELPDPLELKPLRRPAA